MCNCVRSPNTSSIAWCDVFVRGNHFGMEFPGDMLTPLPPEKKKKNLRDNKETIREINIATNELKGNM